MKKIIFVIASFTLLLNGCTLMHARDGGKATPHLGGPISAKMSRLDQLNVNSALESTPTNQTSSWHGERRNTVFAVTPTRTYYNVDGKPCRDYALAAQIDGKNETYQGTACRVEDDTWRTAQ